MISRSAPASAASAATSSMPGVSTTGSSSLGTVLVAGRNRVPKPAAGTTAVRGIGTSGRVIVHTLSGLGLLPIAGYGAVSSLTRGDPDEGRAAGRDPGGPPRGDTAGARRRGRRALPPPARRRRRRADRLRLRPDPNRARLDRRCSTPCSASRTGCCCPSPATTPTASRSRCSGASTARASSSRRGSGCASRPSRGCPPRRWPTRSSVFVPALAVDRAGVRLGRGAGFYDRSLPLADPAARLVAVVRDDELVDELPAEPHDVRMTHALTPGRGLVELALGQQRASTSSIARFSFCDTHSP